MMDYIAFNILESVFWVVVGVVLFKVLIRRGEKFSRLAVYTVSVFIAFGASDIAEIFSGSFLEQSGSWLLVWKSLNFLAIIYAIIWYTYISIEK